MKSLKSLKVLKNKSGQGMVEYILLLVVVVGIVLVMKQKFSEQSGNWFNEMADKVSNVMGNN